MDEWGSRAENVLIVSVRNSERKHLQPEAFFSPVLNRSFVPIAPRLYNWQIFYSMTEQHFKHRHTSYNNISYSLLVWIIKAKSTGSNLLLPRPLPQHYSDTTMWHLVQQLVQGHFNTESAWALKVYVFWPSLVFLLLFWTIAKECTFVKSAFSLQLTFH